jgi:hypothetical protein
MQFPGSDHVCSMGFNLGAEGPYGHQCHTAQTIIAMAAA